MQQLRDMKGAFDLTTFSIDSLSEYAESCWRALAPSMAKVAPPLLSDVQISSKKIT
ncbi:MULTISPECIES: hypothetical protein [Ralstonia]|jgi:hypothetical protein|uniref:Uncharacterized protein n=1 Tax=Ralstonia pickettii OR214 TaxID=1264675 RepID=R0ECJ1_RALPI|nr:MULTISPECIES: hypothetical protein [Ralstonia]ENZ79067.1 hypothetical protein OR214_00635 [Ralstonia pickettii OR214]MCM3580656.1 DUF2252 domain-containing protein [Ralstonia pickettii]MDR9385701.1 hypothetical protein [Ralstonia sp. 11b]